MDAINCFGDVIRYVYLQHPDNLNLKDSSGRSFLMISISANDIDAIKFCLEKGADLTIRDKKGHTALMMAMLDNKDDIANMLIGAGASLTKEDELKVNDIKRARVKDLIDNINTLVDLMAKVKDRIAQQEGGE